MLIVLVAVTFVLYGCASGNEVVDSSQERTTSPNLAERGQEIYVAQCSVCHGQDARGQPNWHIKKADGTLPAPPLNGDGHTWHHGDGLLYQIVREGGALLEGPDVPNFKSGMPAFGDGLNHQEIIDVITYVKSLWGDKESRGIVKTESQAEVSKENPFPPGPN